MRSRPIFLVHALVNPFLIISAMLCSPVVYVFIILHWFNMITRAPSIFALNARHFRSQPVTFSHSLSLSFALLPHASTSLSYWMRLSQSFPLSSFYFKSLNMCNFYFTYSFYMKIIFLKSNCKYLLNESNIEYKIM